MIAVGLICEGQTDSAVIARMLDGLSGGTTTVNTVQPRPGDFGGWQQVFAAIARKDVSGALADNQIVVVQIDTDVCELAGFDVHRREDGRELSEAELVVRVRERLLHEIRAHDPEADLARVVFAICVNELECWLLLHLSPRSTKTTGCLAEANAVLRRANRSPLGSKDGKKNVRAYEDAAKGLRKRSAVDDIATRSASVAAFVQELSPLLVTTD